MKKSSKLTVPLASKSPTIVLPSASTKIETSPGSKPAPERSTVSVGSSTSSLVIVIVPVYDSASSGANVTPISISSLPTKVNGTWVNCTTFPSSSLPTAVKVASPLKANSPVIDKSPTFVNVRSRFLVVPIAMLAKLKAPLMEMSPTTSPSSIEAVKATTVVRLLGSLVVKINSPT